MDERGGCRVVLVGMMGSGKSTVGSLLAEATGWPRYDNDLLLQELYGMTAAELVAARGDQMKREAEDAALRHGLAMTPPFILDAAGGTIDSEDSRNALSDAIVIWLHASAATLYQRAFGAAHRPFLDNGESWMIETDARRRPLYASVADIDVDTEDREPADVAREALRRLARFCPELSNRA
jgi:shikimate kinase